jgi:hypothetical protein
VIFAGIDWAESHHDVCVMGEDGAVLEQRRVAHSVVGIGELHALIATHAEDGEPVAAAIEIDRGLVVTALLAAGYQVYALTRWLSPATGTAMAPRGPSQTGAMRRCWRTWSAPAGTTTGRSPGILAWPRRCGS